MGPEALKAEAEILGALEGRERIDRKDQSLDRIQTKISNRFGWAGDAAIESKKCGINQLEQLRGDREILADKFADLLNGSLIIPEFLNNFRENRRDAGDSVHVHDQLLDLLGFDGGIQGRRA